MRLQAKLELGAGPNSTQGLLGDSQKRSNVLKGHLFQDIGLLGKQVLISPGSCFELHGFHPFLG